MNPHDFRRLVLARELLARHPEPSQPKQAEPAPEPEAHAGHDEPGMAASHAVGD